MEKFKPYILWTTKIIISILFLLASLGKLSKNESVIDMFRNWGYFDGFYFYIGLMECILAVLLLIPRTSLYAAILLFVLMIGALFTHFIHDPYTEMVRPLVFMALISMIIYFQWDKRLFDFNHR